MDYIFTSATCKKREIYQFLTDALLDAGWENISSDPTRDFDVFYSTGEDEDKELCFQMRPTSTSNTNSIIDTDSNIATLRLISEYIPGSDGSLGTFIRSGEPWRTLYIAPTSSSIVRETEVTIYYHVNKNRIIFTIIYPNAVNVNPITHYIGLPDETYVEEPNSKGLLFTSSNYAVSSNSCLITDNVYTLSGSNTAIIRNFYTNIAPKNPNADGLYFMAEAKYGNNIEGLRRKLTGLYFLPNDGVVSGDILQIGTKNFKVIVHGTTGTNGFPSIVLAFQI